MKRLFFLIFILSSLDLSASHILDYVTPDTIKTPEGKELSRKEKRRAARAVAGKDFTLSAEKRKADNLYQNLGFMEAADYYENLEGVEMNTFVQSKLANSYRLNAQYEDAEYWYSQMINNTDNPEDYMNYALVLQSNGKCEDAVRWYGEYLKFTLDETREFITDCDQLETFKVSKDVDVRNMVGLNTEHLDFSPIRYKNGVIFTSNRSSKGGLTVNRDKWTKSSFTDIFYAKIGSNGTVTEVEAMDSDLNGKFHDGVVTFNSQGSLMIFSRSNKKGRGDDGIKDLKLYSSDNSAGYWADPLELNINGENFASCHPALSADGRRLYFASDREGGYGGMDIWVSERLGNRWQEPKNLGPTVNTGGQELFPFIAKNETMYFASNGHRGLGGLDIFVVNKTDEKDETTWSVRENLGAPFNTEKDDFSFTINPDGESGYFSSNRHGGQGGDDVYEWEGELNEKIARNNRRRICVTDERTGNRLPGIDVTVVETAGAGSIINSGDNDIFLKLKPLNNENKEFVLSLAADNNQLVNDREGYTTDNKGNFRYDVNPDRNYVMLIENPKYENYQEKISGSKLISSEEHCLEITEKSCLLLNGTVVNEVYNSRIPNAKVYLFNKCTGETTEEFSDENGEFNFCLSCGCEYEIVGQKRNFTEGRSQVSTLIPDCENTLALGTDLPLETTVKLTVGSPDFTTGGTGPTGVPGTPGATYIFATPDMLAHGNIPLPPGMSREDLNRYFTGKSTPDFEQGQVIKLSNIYYDFDKAFIRRDAARELDYVYQLLKTYPSMHISLLSHTDSRGKDTYNEKLSKRRAESAMLYLVNRGISPGRLTYEGFGESKHVNECENGVNCDEIKHQLNRRTEIKITRFNATRGRVED